MLLFSVLVALFLVVLAWAEEIVGVWSSDEAVVRKLTVALAVFCIYAVDFAINGVQATCRSLIVDTLPESQQQLGSAWGQSQFPIHSQSSAKFLASWQDARVRPRPRLPCWHC